MDYGIRFEGVTKRFGDQEAVSNLNLEVEAGVRLALLGPSGCGKTTALRMLAGVEIPDAGRISLGGDLANDPRLLLPPGDRRIGMVFQSLALWPHMTVEKNLTFVQGRQKDPDRVAKLLDMVNLSKQGKAYPHELSGGEKQRVALARALVADPRILLMDEPMANLDEGLKREILESVKELQDEFGVTMIYVTHDQREALTVGQRLAVMEKGRVLQVGPPTELYHRPADAFVAGFLGRNNILEGAVEGDVFRCPAGAFPYEGEADGGEVFASLRAEDIEPLPDPEGPLSVKSCTFQGRCHVVVCSSGASMLTIEAATAFEAGSTLSVRARRPAFLLPP